MATKKKKAGKSKKGAAKGAVKKGKANKAATDKAAAANTAGLKKAVKKVAKQPRSALKSVKKVAKRVAQGAALGALAGAVEGAVEEVQKASGSDGSGPSSRAYDALMLQRLDGLTVNRPATDDSLAPSRSKFHRFSSGSRALNTELSTFHRAP